MQSHCGLKPFLTNLTLKLRAETARIEPPRKIVDQSLAQDARDKI